MVTTKTSNSFKFDNFDKLALFVVVANIFPLDT